MKLAILACMVAVVGCAQERTIPAPRLELRDTQTIHNTGPTDATRVWIIQRGADGNDRVVLCDMNFLGNPADYRRLCMAWP